MVVDTGDTTVSGVGLGRKKKNCKGKGICVIKGDIKKAVLDDRQTIATLNFNDQSLSTMFIAYSDLSEIARKEYFSNDYFIMEEAYSEPLKMGGKIYKIFISKGKYPISKQRKGLKINFD